MKQLVAAVVTLTLIVSGIVLATSLSSSAQEDGGSSGETTTTLPEEGASTVPDDEVHGIFDFWFDGEVPPELEELKSCLTEQGIEIPDEVDRGFRFELRGLDGISEALEACGLPGFDPPFTFDGELPEGFPFGDRFPGDFDFGAELPEGFPFGGDFDGELPEGFPFGSPGGFGFGLGAELLDRDALATCLAELGSFDSVDQVRAQLDECLPEGPFEGEFGEHHGFGGRGFGGWFDFDFDFDSPSDEVEGADTST